MTSRIKAVFWLAGTAVISLAATLLFWWSAAAAAETGGGATLLPSGAIQWGSAAALSTSHSLGAGVAVASVGSAAIGAMAERRTAGARPDHGGIGRGYRHLWSHHLDPDPEPDSLKYLSTCPCPSTSVTRSRPPDTAWPDSRSVFRFGMNFCR
jgi:hypothetical protein